MFIRPVGPVVHPARRPAGHPLLRGILARGAYVWDVAQIPAEAPEEEAEVPEEEAEAEAEAEARAAEEAPPPAAWPTRPAGPAGREPQSGPGAAPGPGAGTDFMVRLTQLADLVREGLLTPEEFAAAKARLLSS